MAEASSPAQARRIALTAALRLRGAHFALIHEEGHAHLLFGAPPGGFVAACETILQQKAVTRTWIAQTGRGARARLIFAEDLPENVRQRIRNVWTPPSSPTTAGSGRRA